MLSSVASKTYAENANPHILDQISWQERLQEKSLRVYWTGKGHDATAIFAKPESGFGASAPGLRSGFGH
jgi:hypothetical protein